MLACCLLLLGAACTGGSKQPASTHELYLMRHAKAVDKKKGKKDIKRKLSKKGKEDAELMGFILRERAGKIDAIVSSSAKRCKSTAKRMADALSISRDSIIYDSTLYHHKTRGLIRAIQDLKPTWKRVLVIGHNPATIQAANHFQKDTIFTSIPTAALVGIRFETVSWNYLGNKSGDFLFFERPKEFADQIIRPTLVPENQPIEGQPTEEATEQSATETLPLEAVD